MSLTIFISYIILGWRQKLSSPFHPVVGFLLLSLDLHFKIHVQTKQGEMGFSIPLRGCACLYRILFSSTCGSWYSSQRPHTLFWGDCVSPILDQNTLGSHNHGREVHPGLHFTPQYVGQPSLTIGPDCLLQDGTTHHLTYSPSIGAPLFWSTLCYILM